MLLSVIVPLFNSEKTIDRLVQEVSDKLSAEFTLELILVNDASTDNTDTICKQLAGQYSFIKYVQLECNTGEVMAVLCGLTYATGDFTAIIDDDLQNPPSEILKLYSHLIKGYEVVYAQHLVRHQNFLRLLFAWVHNLTATALLKKPYHLYLASFKIMTKKSVKYILSNKEKSVFIDRLLLNSSLKIGKLTVNYSESIRGYSNYTFKKLMTLYLNFYLNRYPVKSWKVK